MIADTAPDDSLHFVKLYFTKWEPPPAGIHSAYDAECVPYGRAEGVFTGSEAARQTNYVVFRATRKRN